LKIHTPEFNFSQPQVDFVWTQKI